MASIDSLLGRSWFERLWIWQEVHLANPQAIVMYGNKVILWREIKTAIFCLYYCSILRAAHSSPETRRKFCFKLCDVAAAGSVGRNLFKLLHATKYAKCSDERDKIFALLSKLRPKERIGSNLSPDYSRTVNATYRDAFLGHSKYSRSLSLLELCELRDERDNVPRWVPEFSMPKIFNRLNVQYASALSECEMILYQ
jgi:hypothetical protein